MGSTAQLTNDLVDDFPKITSGGAPTGPRETDVDIALKAYREQVENGTAGAGVLKFLDYNTDEAGDPVEDKIARARAGGRVNTLKTRGYSIEEGWVIVSRNGAVYAKYFGPGMVPAEYSRAGKAVGEAVPV